MRMFEITDSYSRKPTLKINNLFIHSKYDPEKEASVFVEHNISKVKSGTVIILGSGLGYISNAVKNINKNFRTISIYLDEELYNHSIYKSELSWHPGHEKPFISFLRDNIKEKDLINMKILEWPACLNSFKETGINCTNAIKQYLNELNASIMTTGYFGKTWIKNSFYNFLNIEKYSNIENKSNTVIICSSGPSLEKSLNLIKDHKEKIEIWALPSSIKALLEYKIRPDLVISTDPGFYAFSHLKELRNTDIPIAAPLSSVKGLWKIGCPVILLSNAEFYEKEFISKSNLENISLQPNGTVAGTALKLAEFLNKKNIIFSGQDFCLKDIQEHVKPHSFDPILSNECTKTSPFYYNVYKRVKSLYEFSNEYKVNTSRALLTYAGWFNSVRSSNNANIYRLNPSNISTPSLININNNEFENIIKDLKLNDKKNSHSFCIQKNQRISIAENILNNWKSEIKNLEKAISKGSFSISSQQLELMHYIDTANTIKFHKASAENDLINLKSLSFESINNIYKFFIKLESIINNYKVS